MTDSAQFNPIYQAFLAAVLTGNPNAASAYTAPDFQANLNEFKAGLTVEAFVQEVARQREAFPDLGQYITPFGEPIIDTNARTLALTYTMHVSFSGTLRSDDNSHSVPGDGRAINIVHQDRVTFDDEGKISVLEVVTDMGHTVGQMH